MTILRMCAKMVGKNLNNTEMISNNTTSKNKTKKTQL